jgi:hypothetical protein
MSDYDEICFDCGGDGIIIHKTVDGEYVERECKSCQGDDWNDGAPGLDDFKQKYGIIDFGGEA